MATTVNDLNAEIDKINVQIKQIQSECNHPPSCVDIKAHGSSGNYDPSNDGYWNSYHCLVCDKRWGDNND